MKIKVVDKPYEEVAALAPMEKFLPKKQSYFFNRLIRVLAEQQLRPVNFTYESVDMDPIGDKEPCIYLMNHCSFIDLSAAAKVIGKKPYHIVCTTDGFVGKEWLMKKIGCVPTQKFVSDLKLIKDLVYVFYELQESVLMFPEAGYSLDGTTTALPDGLGKCLKMLQVPVVMIRTQGAFLRDPLYNELQKRKVEIAATQTCLFTPDQLQEMSVDEVNRELKKAFAIDYFREQKEKKIRIEENFRADGLERILYKCPCCLEEGKTRGKGNFLLCESCGQEFFMDEYGSLEMAWEEPKVCEEYRDKYDFTHIPSWFAWEREQAAAEVNDPSYKVEIPVEILMLKDTKALYRVGEGTLIHTKDGFRLNGCENRLNYVQKPKSSYSLNVDYYWYEIGDMISIGNKDALYYCFPKNRDIPVAKMRLAAEELYKLVRQGSKRESDAE